MSKSIILEKKEIEYIQNIFLGPPFIKPNCELRKKIMRKLKRALKPIKTSSAKAKGRELQKWVCKKISEMINFPYDQQDDQCLIHSREMGQAGVDVILRGKALKRFPFTIECKNTEGFSIGSTIAQVENNLISQTDWIIVHNKKAFKQPLVMMYWETFQKLFNKREEKGE